MWLINTKTLELCYFNNDDEVDYAILSHRWEKEEVSMQDLRQGCDPRRKGYAKIKQSCAIALQTNIQYMWIDTCCIDKTSSAELSEAINSMYRWYEQAKICYAYLSDVDTISDLASSKWFTRGWTLQELIAPETVNFFNTNWKSFGSKAGLQRRIASITGIPTRILRGAKPTEYSVAQRMSWAAHRITTRSEDRAYSLMGLFEVNMPMLYGEGGTRAFTRLQEEIIKTLNDHSIFAWTGHTSGYLPVLASSPANFQHGAEIRSTSATSDPTPFSMTNVGLNIQLPIMPFAMNTYLAVLQCQDMTFDKDMMPHARSNSDTTRIGILIRRTPQDRQYFRCILSTEVAVYQIDTTKYASCLRTMPVLLLQRMRKLGELNDMYGFHFRTLTSKIFNNQNGSHGDSWSLGETCQVLCKLPEDRVKKIETLSPGRISRTTDTTQILRHMEQLDLDLRLGEHGTVATFTLRDTDLELAESTIVFVKFGFDFDFNPVSIFYNVSSKENQEWRSHTKSEMSCWADDRDLDEELATYAKMDQGHCWETHGICALRGSRTSGLDVRLKHLGIHLIIAEEFQNGAKKWIVDISTPDLPFERYYQRTVISPKQAVCNLYNAELAKQRWEARLREAMAKPERDFYLVERLLQDLEDAEKRNSLCLRGLYVAYSYEGTEPAEITHATIVRVVTVDSNVRGIEEVDEDREDIGDGSAFARRPKRFKYYQAWDTVSSDEPIIATIMCEANLAIQKRRQEEFGVRRSG